MKNPTDRVQTCILSVGYIYLINHIPCTCASELFQYLYSLFYVGMGCKERRQYVSSVQRLRMGYVQLGYVVAVDLCQSVISVLLVISSNAVSRKISGIGLF